MQVYQPLTESTLTPTLAWVTLTLAKNRVMQNAASACGRGLHFEFKTPDRFDNPENVFDKLTVIDTYPFSNTTDIIQKMGSTLLRLLFTPAAPFLVKKLTQNTVKFLNFLISSGVFLMLTEILFHCNSNYGVIRPPSRNRIKTF